MNLQQLQYFAKAAEYQHFSKAAEELHVSQPALSYAIQMLEGELKTSLFEKEGRNVRLTKDGAAFLVYASSALRQLDSGVKMLSRFRGIETDSLVISCVFAMSGRYLPRLIRSYLADNPSEKPSITLLHSNILNVADQLKNGISQIAFGPFLDDSLIECFDLYKETIMLGVSRNHPLAAKESVRFEDFKDEEMVSFIKSAPIRAKIENLFKANNTVPKIVHEATNETMIAALIDSLDAVGLLPVSRYLEYPGIKLIPLENYTIYRQFYMIRANGRALPPAAQKFWNYVTGKSGLPESSGQSIIEP